MGIIILKLKWSCDFDKEHEKRGKDA